MNAGCSHIGLATHDIAATIHFYEGLLGCARVADHCYEVAEGGSMRMVYFDIGHQQFIVFMAPQGMAGIRPDFSTDINDGLGVPRGIYHLALKAESADELLRRQQQLRAQGVEVSDVVDLGHAHSIFLRDPNGIELEYCWHLRPFGPQDIGASQQVSTAYTP